MWRYFQVKIKETSNFKLRQVVKLFTLWFRISRTDLKHNALKIFAHEWWRGGCGARMQSILQLTIPTPNLPQLLATLRATCCWHRATPSSSRYPVTSSLVPPQADSTAKTNDYCLQRNRDVSPAAPSWLFRLFVCLFLARTEHTLHANGMEDWESWGSWYRNGNGQMSNDGLPALPACSICCLSRTSPSCAAPPPPVLHIYQHQCISHTHTHTNGRTDLDICIYNLKGFLTLRLALRCAR